MSHLGCLLDESNPERWRWWGLSAARGYRNNFLTNFAPLVTSSDPSLAPVVFAIGRALKGHVDMEKRQIFGFGLDFDSRKELANRAIDFYMLQCTAARRAVDLWCLIALRFGNSKLNRDVRKIVASIIWEARHLAQYSESDEISRELMNKRRA